MHRKGAVELSSNLQRLAQQFPDKFNYIGVGLQTEDYDDFVNRNIYKDGKIYLDLEKKSYSVLGFKRERFYTLWGMLNPKVYYNAYKAKQMGLEGNLKGDRTALGGNAFIDRQGNVIWLHVQQNYNDFPDYNELCKVLKEH